MRIWDLLAALRYIVDAVRGVIKQIKAYAKKRRLQKELELQDDETTRRELDRIV